MIGALIFLTVSMLVASFLVARLIQRAFRTVEQEREELRDTMTRCSIATTSSTPSTTSSPRSPTR